MMAKILIKLSRQLRKLRSGDVVIVLLTVNVLFLLYTYQSRRSATGQSSGRDQAAWTSYTSRVEWPDELDIDEFLAKMQSRHNLNHS